MEKKIIALLACVNRNSLRKKIFLLTSVTLIVTILIFISSFYARLKSIYLEDAKVTTQQNINLIQQSITRFVEDLENDTLQAIINETVQQTLINYYDGTIDLQSIERILSKTIHQTVNTNTSIVGSSILLNDGNVLNISQFRHEDVYKTIEEEMKENHYEPFEWSGSYRLRQFNGLFKNVFVIEKKIIDINQATELGYIYMYVDEEALATNYNHSINQTQFIIIDEKNQIISHKDKKFLAQYFYEDIELRDELSNVEHTQTPHQEEEFLTEDVIQGTKWRLMTITPMKALLKSFDELAKMLILFAVGSILIGLLLANRISVYIAKPINDLVETIIGITEGDRERRAKKGKETEMYLLNESFNGLMDTNDRLIKEINKKHKRLREYEFLLLQQQIKPHFLYNSLSTISSLVKLDMNEEAINAVNHLAKFFRISLSGGSDIISLEEEIKLLESYIVIQKYRYTGLIDFEIDVEERILSKRIPKLSLQPIIENAIYHGIRSINKPTKLILKGRIADNKVILSIKDFGNGMTEDEVKEVAHHMNTGGMDSFGLTCVNQRIKLIYGDEYGLSIKSKKKEFTEVYITFPEVGERDV